MKNNYLIVLWFIFSAPAAWAQKPVARFFMDNDTMCAEQCVSFTDSSSNNPTSWQWYFAGGNAATSTDQNPVSCFYTAGTYNIKLVVSNSNGSDSVTRTLVVKPSPAQPVLSFNYDTMFVVYDTSYVSYKWYHDTIVPVSTKPYFVLVPCYGGMYEVVVANSIGCTSFTEINISPIILKAAFGLKSPICQYDCINFTDSSGMCPQTWNWTFNGSPDSVSTLQNPQHVCYNTPGRFDAKLVVTTGNVLIDSLTKTVVVHPSPIVSTILETGDTLHIYPTDTSYSYQWYRNDTLLTGATDSVLYPIFCPNNYNVKITNTYGCSAAVGINVVCGGLEKLGVDGGLTVFPNPADDQLVVHSTLGGAKPMPFSVINLPGQAILEGNLDASGYTSINIKKLKPGLYILQVKTAKGKIAARFIKA